MSSTASATRSLAQQYDLLAHRFHALYAGRAQRGQDSIAAALDDAVEQLTRQGALDPGQGAELVRCLQRDLSQTLADGEQWGGDVKEMFSASGNGDGASASLGAVLRISAGALAARDRSAHPAATYTAGELTAAGMLTCQGCRRKLRLTRTDHVPLCPHCHASVFVKGH